MGNWRRNQCKQIIALSIGLAVVAVASATMNVATYRADLDTKAYVKDQISEVTKRLDELRSDLDGKR